MNEVKRTARLRAAVFDLDGTLIDSLPLVLGSVAHALEPYGPRSATEIFAKLGGPPERFLPNLLDDVQHVTAAMARMDAYHRANAHTIAAFAGALPFLTALRARGVQLAVWTGRDRASMEELFPQTGLKNVFDTVVAGDDLPSHKPDPEGLREIMRRLGVTPAETIFVGDADVDVLGGVAAGVDSVLIEHARGITPEVRAKAWRSVRTTEEVYALLLRCAE